VALARTCGFCFEPLTGCVCDIETPATAPPPIECAACRDTSYVCECHTSRPWGDLCCDGPVREGTGDACPDEVLCEHGACHCGGAGLACPGCRPDLPAKPVRWAARVIDPTGKRM
jgi:hypothetical protein